MERAERFWAKVEVGDCWQWTGSTTQHGYGKFWNGHRPVLSHRFAYELLVGQIPPGMEVDHLCRNIGCVNPDHLEIVTHAENMRRSYPVRKTHCPRGHVYDEANTYVGASRKRQCRTCHRERMRERWRLEHR